MLMNPPVLLPDEPTSALDVAVQRQVVQEMLHVRELFGTTIIIVAHDIGVVSAMADTVLVLKDGNKMEYGPAKEAVSYTHLRWWSIEMHFPMMVIMIKTRRKSFR